MTPETVEAKDRSGVFERARSYSLLDALIHRRSRRFAAGMKLNGGPLA